MSLLIVSLFHFLRDVNLSLAAVSLEMQRIREVGIRLPGSRA
jgi:hypothetical protein